MYITKDIRKYMVDVRRQLHEYPELSWKEQHTSELILQELDQMGVNGYRVCGTGILALIEGADKTHTVGLRADIDALPVQEQTGLDYASRREGVMHACGHDFHIAMLLGAAKRLKNLQRQLPCNVLLMFQPAEEWIAESGAAHMMQLSEVQQLSAITGLHIWNDLPVGKVCVQLGVLMAAADTFDLTVVGKGGHGANPQSVVDPIIVGAQIVNGMQTLVSRENIPTKPLVISICSFQSGDCANVIPDAAMLQGTVRSTEESVRESLPGRIEDMVRGICQAYRASYKWKYERGTLLVDNQQDISQYAKEIMKEIVGPDGLQKLPVQMIGEDFSKYQKSIPGVFVLLGGNDGVHHSPHHSSTFQLSEKAMPYGAEYFVRFCMNYI
ncbi:MAG: amidohydrolase [Lachnospiraceae bacterium]|nr:amidohydrolase [Lachnospiraceae bacterium]